MDAESTSSIRIEIGATEAASEGAKLATLHKSKINVIS